MWLFDVVRWDGSIKDKIGLSPRGNLFLKSGDKRAAINFPLLLASPDIKMIRKIGGNKTRQRRS